MTAPAQQTNGRRTLKVVTISDVARRAGVSPMTVSRVVNGEKHVREETRASVLAAVRALNYAPNQAARTLAGAESLRVGLLYDNPSAAYLGEFMLGALDESGRKSAQLMLEKCDAANAASERNAVKKLIKSGAVGVILPPPLCESRAVLTLLRAERIPAVGVATGRPLQDCSSVRIDDYKAAYEMTSHLIEAGHRRVGFIKGHPNQTASAERLRGYESALHDAGVKRDADLIVQGYFNYRSGLEAAEKLLSLPKPPTAIFASNDDMAAAAVTMAHRRGLDVPRDLSVVGFDDTQIAVTVWPELTTIRQPVAQMAEIALELLIRDISARKKSGAAARTVDRVVDHKLIKRESVASPGGK